MPRKRRPRSSKSAKADAERLAAEAHAKLEDFVARRTKMAETKIAQAEQQALAEVRSVAAEAAVGAAEKVLAQTAKGSVAGTADRPRHRGREEEAELSFLRRLRHRARLQRACFTQPARVKSAAAFAAEGIAAA